MSGVIDKNGVQWERCNRCGEFVEIDTLGYEQPSDQFPYGRDLCQPCYTGKRSEAEVEELLAKQRKWREENAPRIKAEMDEMLKGKEWYKIGPNSFQPLSPDQAKEKGLTDADLMANNPD